MEIPLTFAEMEDECRQKRCSLQPEVPFRGCITIRHQIIEISTTLVDMLEMREVIITRRLMMRAAEYSRRIGGIRRVMSSPDRKYYEDCKAVIWRLSCFLNAEI